MRGTSWGRNRRSTAEIWEGRAHGVSEARAHGCPVGTVHASAHGVLQRRGPWTRGMVAVHTGVRLFTSRRFLGIPWARGLGGPCARGLLGGATFVLIVTFVFLVALGSFY